MKRKSAQKVKYGIQKKAGRLCLPAWLYIEKNYLFSLRPPRPPRRRLLSRPPRPLF
jgi:hypothetical protein